MAPHQKIKLNTTYNSFSVFLLKAYQTFDQLKIPQIGAVILTAVIPVVLLEGSRFPNDNSFYKYWQNDGKAWRWGEAFVMTASVLVSFGLVAFAYFHFLWMKPIRHLLLGLKQVNHSCMYHKIMSSNVLLSYLHWSSYPGC